MRALAIDPGFERLGIAILEKKEGKEILLFSECFTTSAKTPFPERLAEIGAHLEGVIEKWQPKALAIETLLFNNNQKTAMRVAEARGVVVYTGASHKLSIYEYSPSQIKIAVTGYGKATKSQVETMTRSLVAVPEGKVLDDEMDAIAIGLTCLASAGNTYPQKG